MITSIHPCLWFDGQAKAAAEFYCSIFENAKITTDTPMVSIFELNGKKIMGLNGGPMFKVNPSISLFVVCESVEETNRVWDKLFEGGKELMAIGKYPWSERYGWLQDKFGISWQVSTAFEDSKGYKVTPCMLFTGKAFGRAEEAIHLYQSLFKESSLANIHYYPKGDANEGKVTFSEFKLSGYDLIAMDGPGEHKFEFNEGVSIVVECQTQQEIDFLWDKLTAGGGEESMCGWLKDKYGVSWQIIPSILGSLMANPEKFQRVMANVMKMRKLDIETMVNS